MTTLLDDAGLAMTGNAAERAFLQRRLREVS
jgi:hypothetical protein